MVRLTSRGTPQQGQVNAALFGLAGDAAAVPALQVEGVQIVPCGETLPGAADGVPRPRIAPGGVNADHGVAPGSLVNAAQPPRTARQHAAQPAAHAVDAAGDLTEGPFLARFQEFACGRFVHRLAGGAHAVPLAQQGQSLGQDIGDHRVVHAAHQHRRQRRDKGEADEGQQRQHQPRGAQAGAEVEGLDVLLWFHITGSGKSLTSFPRIPGAYRVNCIVLSLDLMY